MNMERDIRIDTLFALISSMNFRETRNRRNTFVRASKLFLILLSVRTVVQEAVGLR